MIVVMLGPPGVGKGTQAARMARRRGMEHISTGDLFREHLKLGTPLGQRAKTFMTQGELVPDDVVIGMVEDKIRAMDGDLILDGFPRTVPQAEALDRILDSTPGRSSSELVAIQLKADEHELMRRLTGRRVCRQEGHIYHEISKPPEQAGRCDLDGSELYQREDDKEETVRRRLEVYDQETGPVLDFYGSAGRLRQVRGEDDRDAVTARLFRVLEVAPVEGAAVEELPLEE